MTAKRPLAGKPDISHWDFPDDLAASEVYLDLLQNLQDLFHEIEGDRFPQIAFDGFSSRVLEAFRTDAWGLFRVFLEGRVYEASTVSSSLNLALVLFLHARANGWSDADTEQLVRAGLVHDVGMLALPPELLSKQGRLSEQERALMENHPSVSFERVRRWGESWEATQVALQHHEEWAGGGYPAGLSGDKIHPWARLAAVAVNFVARITQRTYRNSLVGYDAMKQLIQDQGVRFDPAVVKDFVRALGLNPPGSILLLSDGSIGRVMDVSPGDLLRPRVRLLIDSLGHVYRDDKGPLLDLSGLPKLFIARPVNFQDLLEARGSQAPG